MDNRIKVLVADDNDIMRQMIADSLYDDPKIEVAGEAADGQAAIDLIIKTLPDVVLLDLVMPKIDGLGVMDAIKEMTDYPGKQPLFIIISAAGREDIISQALQSGASYFFMKPFDGDALVKRIKQMCSDTRHNINTGYVTGEVERKGLSIENMVVNLLRSLGVPVKMVGYKYLKDAIVQAVEDSEALMSVTKNIYPAIADEHGTSAGNVERNIRYVIESTWSRQEEPQFEEMIKKVFKDSIKKPTNSEFILICSEWITFQMNN